MNTFATQAARFLVRRDLVDVSGPDAATFLQGQLSQDVALMSAGSVTWSFVLQPNGKLVALLRVKRLTDQNFVMSCDEGAGVLVSERLKRFMLRTKVSVEASTCDVLAIRGETPEEFDSTNGISIDCGWPSGSGVDVFNPTDAQLASGSHEDDAYEGRRILNGIPAFASELTEKTIPEETDWVSRAVSFTKGCYTGQELVARIDSRGHVNKKLRIVSGPGSVPEVGVKLLSASREIGNVTSAAQRGDRFVALAYVGAALDVPGTGELPDKRTIEVTPLPDSE